MDKRTTSFSLLGNLDSTQLNCLNESSEHTLKEMLASADAYLESDVDEQLILNIAFNQKVRVRGIHLRTSGSFAEKAPKDIKLFINRPSLGFEDVEDADEKTATQIMTLNQADVTEGNYIALRYVKFQSVDSLHIFVSTNQGGADTTRIDGIDIIGSLNEVPKDLSELTKNQDDE